MTLQGVYRGTVSDSNDPQRRGRVRVSIPDCGIDSSWAPVCMPAGGATGSLPVGTTVIVAFERGDPAYPVVMGRLV